MEALPHSLLLWDEAAKAALPVWLMAWLGLLALTFVASLLFVRGHVTARVAAAGFVASHVLLYVVFDLGFGFVVRNGLVSLSHVLCWSPALFFLVRELMAGGEEIELPSPYGLWVRMMTFIIVVSLILDVRDAGMYFYYMLTGHPAFGPVG